MQAQGSLRVSSQDMQLLADVVRLLSPPEDAQSHALSTRAHLLARSGVARHWQLQQPLLFAHHD